MTSTPYPQRSEVWVADLDPVRGHEQAGVRPVLVVSSDIFNRSLAGLVIVVPLTTRQRALSSYVVIDPPEGAIRERSSIKCEDVRAISKQRLRQRWGLVSPETMTEIEDRLRILMDL